MPNKKAVPVKTLKVSKEKVSPPAQLKPKIADKKLTPTLSNRSLLLSEEASKKEAIKRKMASERERKIPGRVVEAREQKTPSGAKEKSSEVEMVKENSPETKKEPAEEPRRPKKKVRWVNEESLTRVHQYPPEFAEKKMISLAAFKQGGLKALARLDAEREKQKLLNGKKKGVVATCLWKSPLPLSSLQLQAMGYESTEQHEQKKREKTTLAAIYLKESHIPDDPADPPSEADPPLDHLVPTVHLDRDSRVNESFPAATAPSSVSPSEVSSLFSSLLGSSSSLGLNPNPLAIGGKGMGGFVGGMLSSPSVPPLPLSPNLGFPSGGSTAPLVSNPNANVPLNLPPQIPPNAATNPLQLALMLQVLQNQNPLNSANTNKPNPNPPFSSIASLNIFSNPVLPANKMPFPPQVSFNPVQPNLLNALPNAGSLPPAQLAHLSGQLSFQPNNLPANTTALPLPSNQLSQLSAQLSQLSSLPFGKVNPKSPLPQQPPFNDGRRNKRSFEERNDSRNERFERERRDSREERREGKFDRFERYERDDRERDRFDRRERDDRERDRFDRDRGDRREENDNFSRRNFSRQDKFRQGGGPQGWRRDKIGKNKTWFASEQKKEKPPENKQIQSPNPTPPN